jgi:hypothetical protein
MNAEDFSRQNLAPVPGTRPCVELRAAKLYRSLAT